MLFLKRKNRFSFYKSGKYVCITFDGKLIVNGRNFLDNNYYDLDQINFQIKKKHEKFISDGPKLVYGNASMNWDAVLDQLRQINDSKVQYNIDITQHVKQQRTFGDLWLQTQK